MIKYLTDAHGPTRWVINGIMLCIIAVISYTLGSVGEAHQRCLENQKNRSAIRGIILRGRDIGKPGTPGYDYYRKHLAEAQKARERVDLALRDLPPIECGRSRDR
jgi:hypothetical protein